MLQKFTQSFSIHYRVTNNCFFLLYKASKKTLETHVVAFFPPFIRSHLLFRNSSSLQYLGVFGKIMTIHLRSI